MSSHGARKNRHGNILVLSAFLMIAMMGFLAPPPNGRNILSITASESAISEVHSKEMTAIYSARRLLWRGRETLWCAVAENHGRNCTLRVMRGSSAYPVWGTVYGFYRGNP